MASIPRRGFLRRVLAALVAAPALPSLPSSSGPPFGMPPLTMPPGPISSPLRIMDAVQVNAPTSGFMAEIREYVAFDRILGNSECRDVESYLAGRFGVDLAPGEGSP